MGRVLSSDPCKITFQDQISNSLLGIYYRMPTNEERVQYWADMTPKPGSEEEKNHNPAETRAKWGAGIITGFDAGAFEIPGDDGKTRAISSDPLSPNHDPEWKDKVKKFASDILGVLAMTVFEKSVLRLPVGATDPFAPTSKP